MNGKDRKKKKRVQVLAFCTRNADRGTQYLISYQPLVVDYDVINRAQNLKIFSNQYQDFGKIGKIGTAPIIIDRLRRCML